MSEAVVLVGGLGTRLRPLTLTTPKPMLPVAGAPLLEHLLVRLQLAGIGHVVLATSYRPEVFAEHFGTGASLGLELDYVTEVEPLGTGGGVRNVADRLHSGADEPVLVVNGDVLSGHDLTAQLARHRELDADVSMHLTEVSDAREYGCVPTDEDGRVTAFLEKMSEPVTNQVNAGCYVFRRSVIDAIPSGRPVSVERETFPGLLAAGRVVTGYREVAYWLDLGTPAALVRGSADLVLGRLPSAALPGKAGEALVLHDARTEGATLTRGTVVGHGATVSPGAKVSGSLVMDGAAVGPGALVADSVVGRGASVGAGCVLADAVVGDGARVGARNELRAGVRVWCDAELPDAALRFSSDV